MIIDNVTFPKAERGSYSQYAEDIFVDDYFKSKGSDYKPYYVDVGAHHPVYKSNTYQFYKKGWHGINIDGDPRTSPLFDLYRPKDEILNLLIGQNSEKTQFSLYKEGTENSITTRRTEAPCSKTPSFAKLSVSTVPLKDVLASYAPRYRDFAFLSVGCEASNLNVIKSNDWDFWRPEVVIVDINELNLMSVEKNETVKYMASIGYGLVSYTVVTAIFAKNN